ncbi:hypothetical protein OQA88_12093 [Cercophora sp. LCS_1]
MATTSADFSSPDGVILRSPSKYASSSGISFKPPSLEWLTRTWSVTHSTLSMWRSARNVRITYKPLPPSKDGARERIDDLVEYEKLDGKGVVKSVAGTDTVETVGDATSWNWRGKGLLGLLTSHWEVLGWGERTLVDGTTERWVVTWFAATLFTKEGLDIYCDRKEGVSQETVDAILAQFKRLEAKSVADLVTKDMVPVAINLPWKE